MLEDTCKKLSQIRSTTMSTNSQHCHQNLSSMILNMIDTRVRVKGNIKKRRYNTTQYQILRFKMLTITIKRWKQQHRMIRNLLVLLLMMASSLKITKGQGPMASRTRGTTETGSIESTVPTSKIRLCQNFHK